MGASDRQLLLKTLKVVDLLIMAGVFLLAAVPVSRGGEASFAQFLSLRIKVENFFLFFGLLGMWHILFVALGVYQSQSLASLQGGAHLCFQSHLGGNDLCGIARAALPNSDGDAHFPDRFLASYHRSW